MACPAFLVGSLGTWIWRQKGRGRAGPGGTIPDTFFELGRKSSGGTVVSEKTEFFGPKYGADSPARDSGGHRGDDR